MSSRTKAQTLDYLRAHIQGAKVLPQVRFSTKTFEDEPHAVLDEIRNVFGDTTMIVRSSAKGEDSEASSAAGQFESCANVRLNDLGQAIEQVIQSYGKGEGNEVFVQPHLPDIARCGVVMTADADTLAPYYVINYNETESHDAVTAGGDEEVHTYVAYKRSPLPSPEPWIGQLTKACNECEKLLGRPHLDIEFAFNSRGALYLFQARTIVTREKEDLSTIDFDDALFKAHSKIEKVFRPHPQLLGKRGMLGAMPDWNPAEIIGLRPRPLALSLYKELVTDGIWAYQRDNYGYRNLRSHPLLVSLLGVPFIDVRVSFNSFIPADLDEAIAEKLIDHYLEQLRKHPHHHDKVEFEIVHSCYTPDLRERLNGFTPSEIDAIEASLLRLTRNIITDHLDVDLDKAQQLAIHHERVMASDLPVIDKIYWLIEHCKRYGTLPFAGAARAGFVAVQLLRSAVSPAQADAFMHSLNTVSRQLGHDLHDREAFIEKYGHLRPGSYDILSPRYDENFDAYFPNLNAPSISNQDRCELDIEIEALEISGNELVAFMKKAIEGREEVKFWFTRTLSEILRLLGDLGERLGLSREEMAYVDIQTIKNLYSSLEHRDVAEILREEIVHNRELHRYTKAIRFPSLIVDPSEIYQFQQFVDEPNYVTQKCVQALVATKEDYEGKIACIRSADPGYDFLFSKQIAGLITAYGGVNSHMAIRCAELGIPAVIGAGETNFAQWSRASVLEIDALHRTTRVVS